MALRVLTHFDGANGSQSIVNEVSGGPALTASAAGALTTTTPKFGTASFNGRVAASTVSTATSFTLAGPFCFAVQIRRDGFTGKYFALGYEGTNNGIQLDHYVGNLIVQKTGTTRVDLIDVGGDPIPNNGSAWSHVVINRDASNVIRLIVNGVVIGSTTDATTFTGRLLIGDKWDHGPPGEVPEGGPSNAYIDEFLFDDGDPVYTTFPFTPPTAPYTAGSGSGTFGTDEISAGTEASNRTVALTGAEAETTASSHAQNRTVALARAAAETSASGATPERAIAFNAATTETSAGTTAQAQSTALPGSDVNESSAGSTDQTAGIAFSASVTEASAGTDVSDRTLALGASVSETSTGATSQDWSNNASNSVNEASAGDTIQNRTLALNRSSSESSAAATTQNRSVVLPGTWGTAESSAGTTSQTGAEVVPPPVGNGASGVRRWLTQYYTDYLEKRRKDKEAQELAESIDFEIEQGSAGQVKVVPLPEPVVQLTPSAADRERLRMRLAYERQIQADIESMERTRTLLMQTPTITSTVSVEALRSRHEQDEEEDFLLLSSVL